MSVFVGFPKIPRLFRDITITEKIDGSNGCIAIQPDCDTGLMSVSAQSRNRKLTPESDNHGFAVWVIEHADQLHAALGEGYHFGEWWGQGINRGYGLDHKRFSLFNTKRWTHDGVDPLPGLLDIDGLDVVPVLYSGSFSEDAVHAALDNLDVGGSVAAALVQDGWREAEGVVVYHHAANRMFKVTLSGDGAKG